MTKPVTWVCKDCKMPFRDRELAAKHTREAHHREPKPDLMAELDGFMDFVKGLRK